ncbi:hypothetical protein GCM10027299_10750 [Larkinella ripae]
MPRKAVLSVAGQDFRLLEFNISLGQKINNQGKPASGVYLGDFYFILEGGTDLFFEWLSDPERMESGIVKVYYNQATPFVEYSFVQAYVTTILDNTYENMESGNSYNSVSSVEDMSEKFEFWTNLISLTAKERGDAVAGHALMNSVARTRQFQQRTGFYHVLMVTLACEQVTIRNVTHNNEWTKL